MYAHLKDLYKGILAIINPPFCVTCKTFAVDADKFLCSSCFLTIEPLVTLDVHVTEKYQVKVFCIGNYKHMLQQLILAKNHGNIAASRLLGQLMWEQTDIQHQPFDYIVPIPLHWTRYAWRGYNQAQEMAEVISTLSKKPMINLLKRSKKTITQFALSKEDRSHNVKSAFAVAKYIDPRLFKDKHILLIDDLLTTGSTLQEATRALLKLKPARISALVAARVP